MPTDGSSVRRRRLGAELRRWREAAGMTQSQVAAHFEWHSTKVTRMETGRVGLSPRDVKDLLALYGVDKREEYCDALITLARQTRGHNRAWWNTYKDLLGTDYVGLEDEATSIRTWELAVVPGLLQTEDYARFVITTWEDMRRRPRDIERIVALRMARQQRLAGADPPELSVVIDESVLRRTLGQPEMAQAQFPSGGRAVEAGAHHRPGAPVRGRRHDPVPRRTDDHPGFCRPGARRRLYGERGQRVRPRGRSRRRRAI